MWSTLNKQSKFKVNFKFIVETWKYPQNNQKKVDFLMNVLATISQSRTERSLERKN
jgi:hypothetical protein